MNAAMHRSRWQAALAPTKIKNTYRLKRHENKRFRKGWEWVPQIASTIALGGGSRGDAISRVFSVVVSACDY
eukprot:1440546-Amphidinium_carterae.1